MTDNEKETLRRVEQTLHKTEMQIDGVEVPAEMMPEVIGHGMAVFDALIAIRDGEPFRNETDPKKIANMALRGLGVATPTQEGE